MNPEKKDFIVSSFEAALLNNTEIHWIIAESPAQTCRDVELKLNVEESKIVLEALIAIVKKL